MFGTPSSLLRAPIMDIHDSLYKFIPESARYSLNVIRISMVPYVVSVDKSEGRRGG